MIPAEDGLPTLGRSASSLGVRAEGRDRRPDISVRDGFVAPGTGGMSVTRNDWRGIFPPFLRNALDPDEPDRVWGLDTGGLGESLTFRVDPRNPETHGFIEPARRVRLQEYEDALQETRVKWTVYSVVERLES